MKLIRWLLSNIILIAFVLALTYAYVYWDNLTGEDTPAGKAIAYLSVEYDEVREFLDSYDFGSGRTEQGYQVESEPEVTETASVPQVMPPAARPQQPPPAQAMLQQPPEQIDRPQPPSAPIRRAPPVQTVRPQPPSAPVRQPPVEAVRPQPPATAMVQQPPAMQPSAPAPAEARPAPAETAARTEKPEPDIRTLWIRAREEYHRGNIEQSIVNYQQVIANSENNFDAHGELGNVYLSRGRYRDAAGAYYEAAAILVKQGQRGRARSLLPMLERLDRARAEELNQLLSAPSG